MAGTIADGGWRTADCRGRRPRWQAGQRHPGLVAIQPTGTARPDRILDHRAFGPPAGMAEKDTGTIFVACPLVCRPSIAASGANVSLVTCHPSPAVARRHFLQRTPRRHARPPIRLWGSYRKEIHM